ncbi:glycoside hydrolase N-terminal domain-containing protein [Cohnella sp. CFH 77786]|uniref:glycoside hydrolase family 95 protein n=1 Tax=Cohnella sp. CFH 77786 TaxID=2662265 RepID=UPI00351D2005
MSTMSLWYRKPASEWNEALPIGNGRLGGMVFGYSDRERVQLNEDSVWYGGPMDRNNPDALTSLADIRRMIAEGRLSDAEKLAAEAMSGTPLQMRHYTTLGELYLQFGHREVSDYRRSLDLERGVGSVTYEAEGVRYRREYFASYPAGVLAVRVEAARPGSVSFSAQLSRVHNYYVDQVSSVNGNAIFMTGSCGGRGGSDFAAVLAAFPEGGAVRTLGEYLHVEQADSVTLLLAAATTFREADPYQACMDALEAASGMPYAELLQTHADDHAALFRRVELRLGGAEDRELSGLATDERLQRLRQGEEDHGLAALYFQYGRYLLMASSRPGSLPANLQGIWNEHTIPPWGGKYTININAQMNYWPAETCNLSECHEPLFDLIERPPDGKSDVWLRRVRRSPQHRHLGRYRAAGPLDAGYALADGGGMALSASLGALRIRRGPGPFVQGL